MRHSLLLIAGTTLLLSGCFDDDDDDYQAPEENTAPEAISEAFATQVDTPFTDTLTGNDADGDSLAFALGDAPTLGEVEIDQDGSFTYTPDEETTGEDSFTFTVSDGTADPVTGTITVTIEAEEVAFSAYSRAAFEQEPDDEPLPLNGRDVTQDVEDPENYDDLLEQ